MVLRIHKNTKPNLYLYGKYFLASEADGEETEEEVKPETATRRNVKVVTVKPNNRSKQFADVDIGTEEETPEPDNAATETDAQIMQHLKLVMLVEIMNSLIQMMLRRPVTKQIFLILAKTPIHKMILVEKLVVKMQMLLKQEMKQILQTLLVMKLVLKTMVLQMMVEMPPLTRVMLMKKQNRVPNMIVPENIIYLKNI